MSRSDTSKFPFVVDYAKSGRSTCNTAKRPIPKGALRIGVMVKSPHFDGFQPNWSRASTFFGSGKKIGKKPGSTDEIGGFDDLRPKDQAQVEEYIVKYAPDQERKDPNEIAEVKKVRDQAELVWKLRDCTTNKPTAIAVKIVKTILEANDIPASKGISPVDLIRMLAEAIVFGVATPGNKEEGCCASRPLRFSTYYCRYVCQATLEWGQCPYSQAVDDTTCSPIEIPEEVKTKQAKWYKAIKKVLEMKDDDDSFAPQKRLFLAKKNLPTPPHVEQKDKKPKGVTATPKQVRVGASKLHLSRARLDPESGLDSGYHVLDEAYTMMKGKKAAGDSGRPDPKESFPVELYDAILCRTDLSTGTNSQYKLQILVPDGQARPGHCYLWRVWGRVGGTGGGGNKLEKFNTLKQAKQEFCELYEKRTGNEWKDRKSFVKHPGKFFQLEISHGEEDKKAGSADGSSIVIGDPNSKLPRRLHPVIASIFDKNIAAQQLLRVNFDASKMPLGNMTEAQLRDAYSVLTKIEKILNPQQATAAASTASANASTSGSGSAAAPSSPTSDAMKKGKLQQLSNQFYSKCPSTDPKMIDTMSVLKEKVEMVDELINLQASNKVMKDDVKHDDVKSPMDEAYEKLNTKLAPMDPHGKEYAMLKKYVENTRNATAEGVSGWGGNDWGSRGLRLLDVFEVEREGEAPRFESSKALGNRRLLWHGSRISNYSGILSQGLRIAPPEAPVSGYRFGKGIYFADMLGKSANYCRTNGSSEMLVMACDVSLGKAFETPHDMYMDKPQKGTNSTHALSEIIPDPDTYEEIQDDPKEDNTMDDTNMVKVPLGKPIKSSLASQPSCDVSEFIVYDIGQVNIRYLLRLTTSDETVAADDAEAEDEVENEADAKAKPASDANDDNGDDAKPAAKKSPPKPSTKVPATATATSTPIAAKAAPAPSPKRKRAPKKPKAAAAAAAPKSPTKSGGAKSKAKPASKRAKMAHVPATASAPASAKSSMSKSSTTKASTTAKSPTAKSSNAKTPKKAVTPPSFIALEKEDTSVPSLSGEKVIESLTFEGGLRITLVKGDVVESKTDAIAVSCDDKLQPLGAIGTRVKAAAGPDFVAEIDALVPPPPSPTVAPVVVRTSPPDTKLPANFKRIYSGPTADTIRNVIMDADEEWEDMFYLVEQTEKLSSNDEIVCIEADGTFRKGEEARKLLGVGHKRNEHITMKQIPTGAEVYVQSSPHRRIKPRTPILLEQLMPMSDDEDDAAAAATTATPADASTAPAVAPAVATASAPASAAPPKTTAASKPAAPAKPLDLKMTDVHALKGHSLAASTVISVVELKCPASQQKKGKELLTMAVMNMLKKCAELKLTSIALPGFDVVGSTIKKRDTAMCTIKAIATYLAEANANDNSSAKGSGSSQPIKEVCFCIGHARSVQAYHQAMQSQDRPE